MKFAGNAMKIWFTDEICMTSEEETERRRLCLIGEIKKQAGTLKILTEKSGFKSKRSFFDAQFINVML